MIQLSIVAALVGLPFWALESPVKTLAATLGQPGRWLLLFAYGLAFLMSEVIPGARLFLALPSAALDGRVGLRGSFEATAGNSWRLLALWTLVAIPFLFLSMVHDAWLAWTDGIGWVGGLVRVTIDTILAFYKTAVAVGTFSYGYQVLKRTPAETTGAAA